jgi:SAM-dependent methyltransferase
MSEPDQVIRHYGLEDLRERLAAALRAAGLDRTQLSPEDLAPLDQFHTRGLAATIELASSVGIKRNAEVLDIGSGLGGPSRYLAAKYGCHVQGVDLSPAYVTAATYLAERAGLTDRVSYQRADAVRLPFPAEHFDAAWTQHVAMNIADRPALYAEAFRVLRKGGRFAIYDVVQGEGGPPLFPVPWSRTPATSFLLTADAMQRALEAQGFQRITWADKTDASVRWFDEQQKARSLEPTPSPLGLHVVMGPEFRTMAANLNLNVRERRVAIVETVFERPGA